MERRERDCIVRNLRDLEEDKRKEIINTLLSIFLSDASLHQLRSVAMRIRDYKECKLPDDDNLDNLIDSSIETLEESYEVAAVRKIVCYLFDNLDTEKKTHLMSEIVFNKKTKKDKSKSLEDAINMQFGEEEEEEESINGIETSNGVLFEWNTSTVTISI